MVDQLSNEQHCHPWSQSSGMITPEVYFVFKSPRRVWTFPFCQLRAQIPNTTPDTFIFMLTVNTNNQLREYESQLISDESFTLQYMCLAVPHVSQCLPVRQTAEQ